ncbi:MAG: 50S ribosomal protein L18 [Candidatus Bostrichicola ureolyticus]|nr:MAG: 50S ribosomal protein L18 [Candidatus Bostrichicola ureolyticus]
MLKINRRLKIKYRIRKKIFGTSQIPRLSVFRSNKEIYAQIIDDSKRITLVSASSLNKKYDDNKSKLFIATEVGKRLGIKAKNIGLKKVVFDRNGYLYHGRIKNLAEGVKKYLKL